MKKLKLKLFFIVATILLFTGYETHSKMNFLKFYQEEIFLNCYKERIEVEANYHLLNNSDNFINVKIGCQFPSDTLHEYPYDIEVKGYNHEKFDESNICWDMQFDPNEKKDVTVKYKQKIKSKLARYILTTTQKWGEPFKQAEYYISVPKNWTNIRISYPYDKMTVKENRLHYYIKRENFLPKKDLIVKWNLKGKRR